MSRSLWKNSFVPVSYLRIFFSRKTIFKISPSVQKSSTLIPELRGSRFFVPSAKKEFIVEDIHIGQKVGSFVLRRKRRQNSKK